MEENMGLACGNSDHQDFLHVLVGDTYKPLSATVTGGKMIKIWWWLVAYCNCCFLKGLSSKINIHQNLKIRRKRNEVAVPMLEILCDKSPYIYIYWFKYIRIYIYISVCVAMWCIFHPVNKLPCQETYTHKSKKTKIKPNSHPMKNKIHTTSPLRGSFLWFWGATLGECGCVIGT